MVQVIKSKKNEITSKSDTGRQTNGHFLLFLLEGPSVSQIMGHETKKKLPYQNMMDFWLLCGQLNTVLEESYAFGLFYEQR